MPDFFEESIRNYSGKSTDEKPTAAGGTNVPNGSRFREVDVSTKITKVFHYNKEEDKWYPTGCATTTIDIGSSSMSEVTDTTTQQLLLEILLELRISNIHLKSITNEVIDEEDLECR